MLKNDGVGLVKTDPTADALRRNVMSGAVEKSAVNVGNIFGSLPLVNSAPIRYDPGASSAGVTGTARNLSCNGFVAPESTVAVTNRIPRNSRSQ